MTRIKLLTFIVSFLLIFSISATVFSRGGVIVNAGLRREVEEMQLERERKEAEVELLRGDLEAMERGRTEESESVFISSIPDSGRSADIPPEDTSEIKHEERKEGFKGLSPAIILLVSVSGAIVITGAVSFLPQVRRKSGEEREEKINQRQPKRRGGPSSYDDIDLV